MVEQPQHVTSFNVFLSPSVDMQMHRIIFAFLPNTTIPFIVASEGVTQADTEPAVIVAFDFPQQELAPASKGVQETRDVDAFLSDALPAGRITSPSIVNPNDPPDVLAYIDGNQFGLEATQFIPPDSELSKSNSIIGRWMVFERFRNKILQEDPNTLAQHRGLIVVVHFGKIGAGPAERLPPKPADVDSAIASLKAVEPIIRDSATAVSPNPGNMSDIVRWSADKSAFLTWTPLPPWCTSPFYDQMGFELALGYHVTITQTEIRDELRRVIADHDSEKTETLVVTINAPLRSGLVFPTNKLMAYMLFKDEQPLNGWKPSHIKLIALHDQRERAVRWIFGSNPWG